MLLYRDELLFYKSTSEGREIRFDSPVEEVSVCYSDQELLGIKYYSKIQSEDSDCLIIIQGVGGNKTFYHTMISNLQVIYPEKSIYIFDYPGHGKCTGNKSLQNCINAVEQIIIWSQQYNKVTWVTHCFGTVLLAKALEKVQTIQSDYLPSNILIINGFMDPYQYGVKPLPIWFYQYVLCPLLPSWIKAEIQCKNVYLHLKQKGCNIRVYHNFNDKYVHVEHGRRIAEIVGTENYYECDKAGSKNYHHMTVDHQNEALSAFLREIV